MSKTITNRDDMEAWRSAVEGDTYLDRQGRHWLCQGTHVKPAPRPDAGGSNENLAQSWKAERGIPADVDVKYETSYTKRVVEELLGARSSLNGLWLSAEAILRAVDLLKDYHKSLAVPYAQRDEARRALN